MTRNVIISSFALKTMLLICNTIYKAFLTELSFQPVKCENLRISRKRNCIDRSYFLNDVQLKTVGASRDLRLSILVSKDFIQWATHINSIIAKDNKMLGFLCRNCPRHLPLDTQCTSALYALT